MKHSFTVHYPGDETHSFFFDMEEDKTITQILEKIFAWFNHGSGQEAPIFLQRKIRSLSVNDFVRLNGQWYQCKSVGWEKVTNEYVDRIDRAVITHPKYVELGGTFCMSDIMWKKSSGA